MSTSAQVSLSSWTRVSTQLTELSTGSPPRRLQGRLVGGVIRRRSSNAQEDFKEKLIVAYAPLENADSDHLSLFWPTLLEWNLAPPRRSNTIIITDANGRTGLDDAQAANHDKNTDWNAEWGQLLGKHDCKRQGNGQPFATKWDRAWIILGEMVNRQLSLRCLPQATGLTTLPLARNALMVAEIETCYEHGQGPPAQLSNMTMFRFMSDFQPARRWRRGNDRAEVMTETLLALAGTMLPCVGR